jgi:hypothetical protein
MGRRVALYFSIYASKEPAASIFRLKYLKTEAASSSEELVTLLIASHYVPEEKSSLQQS